jgi:hypothetical protein
MYETLEGIAEQSERIASLEELVLDMHETIEARNAWWDASAKDSKRYADRMRELGVAE